MADSGYCVAHPTLDGLQYSVPDCDYMLNCFHPIPERYGQTDGRTDIFAISISRVSMLTRDIDMLGDTVLGLSVEALALRLWRRLHHCLIPYFNPVFNPIINDNLNPAIDLTLSLLIHRMQISS